MNLEQKFRHWYNLYGRFLWFFAMVSGVGCFVMMWLIDVNAISRKLLNAPVPAGYEITQSILTFVIMLPFGYALMKRDHVRTVFLTRHFSQKVNIALYGMWMVVGFVLFMLVTWGAYKYALRSYSIGEMVWGASFRFPIWPAKMSVCFATLLISIQFLLDAILAFAFGDDREEGNDYMMGSQDV